MLMIFVSDAISLYRPIVRQGTLKTIMIYLNTCQLRRYIFWTIDSFINLSILIISSNLYLRIPNVSSIVILPAKLYEFITSLVRDTCSGQTTLLNLSTNPDDESKGSLRNTGLQLILIWLIAR
jgi:hypothetical protein